MTDDARKVEEELSRSVIQLLLKEPFFGHLLGGVARSVTDRTPTMAVGVFDGQVRLLVNPSFFLTSVRRKEERVAVVKHETLHLLFKHILRADPRTHDLRLFNVAADLVVNQLIGRPWKLPDDAVTLDTFPDLDLKPDQDVGWYYQKLVALSEEMRQAGGHGQGGPGARGARPGLGSTGSGSTGSGSTGSGSTGSGRGRSGSGGVAGDAGADDVRGADDRKSSQDGTPSSVPGAFEGTSAPKSAEALARMGRWHSDHDHWAGQEEDAEATAAEAALDGLIARTADRVGSKEWGRLPGPLRALVEAALERRRPQVDWRRVLRMFASSSRRSRVADTVRRRSKRFGTYPGIKVKRLSRIAVAIDTSGSVGDQDLEVLFSEVHGIWRQGAEVHVIECDATIQRSYLYRGRFPEVVAGRGGTAFDPVFEYLKQDRMTIWDGCIYLTDGRAPAPSVEPPCRLLWIVTSDGDAGNHLRFGRAVKLGGRARAAR